MNLAAYPPPARSGPWSPKDATERIRFIGTHSGLSLTYRLHARDRLSERGLIVSDILYALKNGFVYKEPVAATRPGYHRYLVESSTPNSNGRDIGVVVIPDQKVLELKVVTVMWVDEFETRAGTIIGGNDD